MKKAFVLLLMLTLFFAFSCGGEGVQDILEEGVQDILEGDVQDILEGDVQNILEEDVPDNDITDIRNILIFHPDETIVGSDVNPDGTLVGSDVTDLREYRKDIPIFGKFMKVLSTANPDGTLVGSEGNSGWVAYRWKDGSETDCDGDYKVSYLERVSDNRFVGGGMCLLDTGRGNWWRLYQPNDDRFIILWKLIHTATLDINNKGDSRGVYTVCDRWYNAGQIGYVPDDEARELYLFIGELKNSSTDGSVSVDVKCHTDGTIIGTTYTFTDNARREFREEAVDELNSVSSGSERDEGIWNAYTFPKPGQRSTLSDPPKLSYLRISDKVYGKRYIVGAGIYLDIDNPDVDFNNPARVSLREIRSRVREAAELLRGKEGEELIEALEDNRDYFTNDEDPEKYIFVWENRPE